MHSSQLLHHRAIFGAMNLLLVFGGLDFSMNRLVSALVVVSMCIMGATLFYLPWTSIWERNYFLSHFPSLMRVLLNPAFRGAVSGLGVLDILVAVTMIGPDPQPAPVSPPATPSRVPPH